MVTFSSTGEDDAHVHAPDVPGLARELHVQLQRYIEAQYPIRHPSVVAVRRALLESPGVISREPFIESLPGYVPGPLYHELIPISVLRDHSKMREVSHRTEMLRVGFQLIESFTHLVNHGIKRGKSKIRELFFA